jgi:hypothetical protein
MAEELLVIPWDKHGSSESKNSEGQGGGKDDTAGAGAGTGTAGAGAGLKRSASVKVAAGSGSVAGKKGEHDEEEEEDADVEDGSEGEFRRDQFGPSTAIKKPAGSSATGKSSRGRGGTDNKAVRGRRKLFQVDIPKEEDEDEIMDELEALEHVQNHGDDDDPVNAELDRFTIIGNKELLEPRAEPGTEVNKSKRSRNRNGNNNIEKLRRMREASASSSVGMGSGVEKFPTPTLRDPLAGDPSRGVSVPLHDVSLNDDDDKVDHAEGGSDSDDSGGSGGSDPEEAVTGAAVDSDEEDEKMVEDVGSGL